MGFRTVYGNTRSENGWPMIDQESCEWVDVPGTHPTVKLQIAKGQPTQLLRAFAADFNAYVEPLRDPDSACWTPTNSVGSSNHLSGTAMDLNWDSHPFRIADAGFDAGKLGKMRELLEWYEGTIFWGNDWQNPKDAMHVQVGYDTFNNPKTADFISRKIRSDGFSTYKRGQTAELPAATALDGPAILSDAMGNSLPMQRYRDLFPAVSACLRECGCNSVPRIAMWCAQVGHESGGLKWMQEIADGSAYNGRADLGNTQPGDGPRFKGHGPIQVTGRHNHQKCSDWAYAKGLVPEQNYFVNHPEELASDKYGFLGVAWYWTTQRDMNGASDSQDLDRATRYVNGGLNGIDDRRRRYEHCKSMGDRLLGLLAGVEAKPKEMRPPVEKVLTWDKGITNQERYWDCGPATTQVILSGRGIFVSEDELIRIIGTTTNGTDSIAQIELRALDHYCPEANYTTVWLPQDPPTDEQREAFWQHLRASIDNGYGVAMNWVSPPNNPPRPVNGSTAIPGFYGKSTVYHYVPAMGYAEEGGQRFVRIGDPGGQPNEYWVTLEQCVILMAPKGYVWASAFKPVEKLSAPTQLAPKVEAAVTGKHQSRSIYRANNDPILDVQDAVLNIDGMCHAGLIVEPAALRGELWAIDLVAKLARGEGAGARTWFDPNKTDTWAISRAQAILLLIERANPDALRAYISAAQKGITA